MSIQSAISVLALMVIGVVVVPIWLSLRLARRFLLLELQNGTTPPEDASDRLRALAGTFYLIWVAMFLSVAALVAWIHPTWSFGWATAIMLLPAWLLPFLVRSVFDRNINPDHT